MIRDDSHRQLIDSIVIDADISDRLRTAPAALKIHHAFRSGLLEHIVSLCSLERGFLFCHSLPYDAPKFMTPEFTRRVELIGP
jgi:hypothetical protein